MISEKCEQLLQVFNVNKNRLKFIPTTTCAQLKRRQCFENKEILSQF